MIYTYNKLSKYGITPSSPVESPSPISSTTISPEENKEKEEKEKEEKEDKPDDPII